jgi:hypothetical protein
MSYQYQTIIILTSRGGDGFARNELQAIIITGIKWKRDELEISINN